MPFTLQAATAVWNKIQQGDQTATSLTAFMGNLAMDLADYQSHQDIEKKLREIFQQAGVEYPESTHVLHLKTTLLTALSRLDAG
ncbi:hypothetical protein [Sporomusa termitida]|uniref:Uncharacterized protein n=1 Tax=Sporomusa termitida TaxID=2377 RepID=A0A517DWH5_9FIRM|nr:hypothetical protein [Sporomusa termitida]QDR81683.1 hypothetical protein SPTER_30950 [Sporomusa termitida]